jgi:outer membrane protein assembly factor BamB
MKLKPFTEALALVVGCISLNAADSWPQWLGPNRNATLARETAVPSSIPTEPKSIWRIPVGGGFSSPVISGDSLVYLDDRSGQETAHCINAVNGQEKWSIPIADTFQDEWGAGSRSTPSIDKDRVYALSCKGEFRCLNLKDGKVIWGTSFEKDFGVKFLGSKANEGTATRRGHNGSPLIMGDFIFVPVGSTNDAMLVCFNKKNGKIIWKSGTDETAYSSPVLGKIAGKEQLVYLSADALMGMEPETGKILWRVPLKTNAKRHAATPLIEGDSVIVNSHTFGVIRFAIEQKEGQFSAKQQWANRQLQINVATPVIVDGHLYCQGPKKDFICADLETGKTEWSQPGFGKEYSATMVFGKNLLILVDDGQLVLAEANPTKYVELSRVQICGKNWSFPAYANGQLFVRDNRELACFKLLAE